MVAPKREKMACQRSMTQKKREKRGVTMSQKRRRERQGWFERKAITSRSKPYPSTHTLAPFDRDCMTCFYMDPLFDFTINRIQVCPVLILPWAPQRLVVVGKIKGKHCPVRKYKMSASRELSWGLCHVFKNLSKKCLQMDCGSMNK